LAWQVLALRLVQMEPEIEQLHQAMKHATQTQAVYGISNCYENWAQDLSGLCTALSAWNPGVYMQ